MKDEEIKSFLKENMQEKAPENFTMNIMDALNKEAKTQPIINYSLPGKGLLFSLAIFFIVSVLWAMNSDSTSQIDLSKFTEYFQFSMPKIGFNTLVYSNIVMYVCLAFLGFIVLDYIIYRNKNVQLAS